MVYTSHISEKIANSYVSSSNNYTFSYTNSAVYYITNAASANYTVNITNLLSITDMTRSYVFSTINYASGGAGYYASSITLSTSASASGTFTPIYFPGGATIISITSAAMSVQSFSVLSTSPASSVVLSNVIGYKS